MFVPKAVVVPTQNKPVRSPSFIESQYGAKREPQHQLPCYKVYLDLLNFAIDSEHGSDNQVGQHRFVGNGTGKKEGRQARIFCRQMIELKHNSTRSIGSNFCAIHFRHKIGSFTYDAPLITERCIFIISEASKEIFLWNE